MAKKNLNGECDFKFSFPDDDRFKGLTEKQKREHMRRAVISVMSVGNIKVSRVRLSIDE